MFAYEELIARLEGPAPDPSQAAQAVLDGERPAVAVGLNLPDDQFNALAVGQRVPTLDNGWDDLVSEHLPTYGRISVMHADGHPAGVIRYPGCWEDKKHRHDALVAMSRLLVDYRVRWSVHMLGITPDRVEGAQRLAAARPGVQVLLAADEAGHGERHKQWPQGVRAWELPDGADEIVEIDDIPVVARYGNVVVVAVSPFTRGDTVTSSQSTERKQMAGIVFGLARNLVQLPAQPKLTVAHPWAAVINQTMSARALINARRSFTPVARVRAAEQAARRVQAARRALDAAESLAARIDTGQEIDDLLGLQANLARAAAKCELVSQATVANVEGKLCALILLHPYVFTNNHDILCRVGETELRAQVNVVGEIEELTIHATDQSHQHRTKVEFDARLADAFNTLLLVNDDAAQTSRDLTDMAQWAVGRMPECYLFGYQNAFHVEGQQTGWVLPAPEMDTTRLLLA